MKKIFIFCLIGFIELIAQTDTVRSKIPEIELPDFVITGQATVEMPQQNKNATELITPLSKEFILPKIKVQELKLEGLSDPAKQQPSIIDSSTKYNGRIKTAAGLYTLPELDFYYALKVEQYKFNIGGILINSKDYERNSKFFRSNVFTNNTLIIKKEDQPPARLNLNTRFDYFRYSNFKSLSADTFNTITNLNFGGSLENLFYREFNLTLGGNFDYQKLNRWNYSFVELSAFGTLKSSFEHFELTASAQPFIYKISKEYTKNTLILSAYGELYFRKLFNVMNIITRMDYQSEKEDGKQFLAPSIRLGFGLSDYWTLNLFYENKLLNKTPINLWNENPYLDSSSFNYSIERYKNRFGFGTIIYFDRRSNVKIELSNYSVMGKNVFVASTSPKDSGYFNLQKLETNATEINTFLFLDFNNFGNLLFNFKYINSRLTETTRQEPHVPKLQFKFTYGYKFNNPLSLKLSFLYNSVSYGDKNLVNKIAPFINFDLEGNYEINRWLNAGVEIKNLLNKKNYQWLNYNQKPIEILLYLKSRF